MGSLPREQPGGEQGWAMQGVKSAPEAEACSRAGSLHAPPRPTCEQRTQFPGPSQRLRGALRRKTVPPEDLTRLSNPPASSRSPEPRRQGPRKLGQLRPCCQPSCHTRGGLRGGGGVCLRLALQSWELGEVWGPAKAFMMLGESSF